MRVHFIQHEVYEAPGAYLTWAVKNKFQVTFSKVYEGQPLPKNLDNIDFLIIMGGPQSPETSMEECPYFDAQTEMGLIKEALTKQKKVIGVCLGAQLIGYCFSESVEKSPEVEIGNFQLTLTKMGRENKYFKAFPSTFISSHWHRDMPGLTDKNLILAKSKGCPRQIIAYTDNIFGFQCHLEFNKSLVEQLIEQEKDLLERSRKHIFIQNPQELLNFDYTEMNKILYCFLDRFIAI